MQFLLNQDPVLRITTKTGNKLELKLEGRLIGPWVDVLRKTVSRAEPGQGMEIDVKELTFADEEGEKALRWLHRLGARFQGTDSISRNLFARLKIPLYRRPPAELDGESDQAPDDDKERRSPRTGWRPGTNE